MYCKKCGTENIDGSRFCKKCGAELTPAVTPVHFPYEESELIDEELYIEKPAPKKHGKKKAAVIIIAILLIIGAAAVILWPKLKPMIENHKAYNAAVELMQAGDYNAAILAFRKLNGYKDSAEQIASCQTALKEVDYNAAVSLMTEGKYGEAIAAFEELGDYKDSVEKIIEVKAASLKNPNVGDIVCFGSYEQNGNGKEDIEWIVLDKKDGKALLISKYILAHRQYNRTRGYVTWENCTLRTWLNDTFLNYAFSAEEQQKVATTYVSADENPSYNTNPGNATYDKVFLLSINEAEKYFASSLDRKTTTTAYKKEGKRIGCRWWLRSPGHYQSFAAAVYGDGSVYGNGNDVSDDDNGVRPVLWINLDD